MMSVNNKLQTAMLSMLVTTSAVYAQNVTDSVDVYVNQTVDSRVVIQGRDTLKSHDITVTSTGDLRMSAPNGIIITAPFTVELGGKLELNGGRQYHVLYSYDLSGNIVRRKKN